MNIELVHFRFFKKETTGWINCIFRDKVLLFRRLLQLKSDLCSRQVYGWLTWWPEALTSFLAAALGRVCVLFLCSSRAACARTRCTRVFSVTLSQSHEVRWDEVWFLIPGRVDSCKTSDKRHSETVKYTSSTHYLFFSHFFTLKLWSPAGRWTSNLQLGTVLF